MQVNALTSSRKASVIEAFNPWTSSKCPIDRYYDEVATARAFYAKVEGTTVLAGSQVKKQDLALLRELIFLRCVTAFEDYLKLLMGMCVSVLPCCKELTQRKTIPMFAVQYYPADRFGLGLVEGKSPSESSDFLSQLEENVGVKLNKKDPLFVDLDLVLQLRHSLVHSLGILSAHDASKVNAMDKIGQRISISDDLLGDCMAVIDRAVRSINQDVFSRIEERWWMVKGFLTGDVVKDQIAFAPLAKIFWSTKDMGEKELHEIYGISKVEWHPRVLKKATAAAQIKTAAEETPATGS